jgi:integrase/recombinase XerD
MKYRRLARTLEALGRRADVDDVHPHRFRHTAAVEFLRNDGNVFALQMMLGHSTLEMVKHYVELLQQDVQRVHKTASPADNWKLA